MCLIRALCKLRAYEQRKSVKFIASETNLDNGYISRVFNNKINIIKQRNINKICKVLDINYNEVYKDSKYNMKLFEKFISGIYTLDEDLSTYYEDILSLEEKNKSNTFYIYILLTKFIYATYKNNIDMQATGLVKKLLHIQKSLEDYERKIFLIFFLNYLRNKHEYTSILNVIEEIDSILLGDDILNVMYHYYLVIYYGNTRSINYYQYYALCCNMCINGNNNKRLFNLKIIHANFLRRGGYLDDALSTDIETLNSIKEAGYCSIEGYLLNNIAWTYLLLDDYEKAIDFYLKTIVLLEDNDIYFSLAWCYYCTNSNKEAIKYVERGKSSENFFEYFYLLLEWLEKMINRKYSKKSLKLLLDVLAYHSDSLSKNMKEFVYNQIIDYYKYHKDFALALYYSDELNSIVYEQ